MVWIHLHIQFKGLGKRANDLNSVITEGRRTMQTYAVKLTQKYINLILRNFNGNFKQLGK